MYFVYKYLNKLKVSTFQTLADSLKGEKGSLEGIKCDVTKEDEVLAMFAQIKNQHGGVDVLVNNAGLGKAAPLLTGSTADWKQMFDVRMD